MSDKELVRRTRLRVARLEKLGIVNDTTRLLKQELNAFYKKNPSKKTSRTGISITKKMNVEERKQMRSILRAFYKSEESTPEGIEKKYKKIFKEYQKDRLFTSIGKTEDLTKMNKDIEAIKRIMVDNRLKSIYESKVISTIWDRQKTSGISPDKYRDAMLRFIEESTGVGEEDLMSGQINSGSIYDMYSEDYVIDTINKYAHEG